MKKTPRAKRVRRKRRARAASSTLDTQVQPEAAGIDVGAEELYVAVPPGRAQECVRVFSSFTEGLRALRDWLLACKIRTVAMESTGNYWINAYMLLEEAGLEVCLVNARHCQGVPGRKTDVCDAQWLQQLHAAGLLKKSFRPAREIASLRYLMRHRSGLVEDAARQTQLMQKVLTEMNLQIHHVFSDLDGVSGERIVEAILAGERDAQTLADLRDPRCRTPRAKVIAALEGDYRAEFIFVLGQCHQRRQAIASAIRDCDEQIGLLIAAVPCVEHGRTLPPAGKREHSKNGLNLAMREEAFRFYGVDLLSIPGVGTNLLATLISEVGTGVQMLDSFRSAQAFASWLGLCPDNRITGGKVLSAKTRSVVNRVSNVLRMCAQSLTRSKDRLGDYCRRMKGKLGKAEGTSATAHKLARIIYAMVKTGQPYAEEIAFKLTPTTLARRIRSVQKQAAQLGLQVLPAG